MINYRNNLIIALIVVFFLFFDTHFQMPVLAPYAFSLGATPFLAGLVVGIYSFFNIAGNMVSGFIIDRRGGKGPVAVGMIMVVFCLFAYSFAASPFTLLIVRTFHGFAGGLIIPATLIYITQNYSDTENAPFSNRMSFYGTAIGLASLTGPTAAGLLASHFGYANAYLAMAVFMSLAIIPILIFLREEPIEAGRKLLFREYYGHIKSSAFLGAAFRLIFILKGATGMLASFLPAKAESLGASPAVTGVLYGTFAAAAIITHLCWPSIARKFNLLPASLAGLLILCISLILINQVTLMAALFSALVIYGAGFGILFPATLEMVARGSRPEWKGMATAVFFVFFSLGAAMLPPLGGALLQSPAEISPFITTVSVAAVISISIIIKKEFRDLLR